MARARPLDSAQEATGRTLPRLRMGFNAGAQFYLSILPPPSFNSLFIIHKKLKID